MAAIAPIMEEATGTLPVPIIIGGSMNVVLTLELRFEASELYALGLFRVAFCLRNFVDHT
jgi:hypothetical protein